MTLLHTSTCFVSDSNGFEEDFNLGVVSGLSPMIPS